MEEIPEVVLKTAPSLAQRFQDLVALLADGTRELELVRVDDWFLWCREGSWFWGRRGNDERPISADFAFDLIEETLEARPGVQPIVVETGLV